MNCVKVASAVVVITANQDLRDQNEWVLLFTCSVNTSGTLLITKNVSHAVIRIRYRRANFFIVCGMCSVW